MTYRSVIRNQGERHHLGYYDTAQEAAVARDKFILNNEIPGARLQILIDERKVNKKIIVATIV